MKKNKTEILQHIINTPLMIKPSVLEVILSGGLEIQAGYGLSERSQAQNNYSGGTTAVIPVYGVLSYRNVDIFDMLFGEVTTYTQIRDWFQAALDNPDVEKVIMDIDSPGDEVAGVFDLTDFIYEARGKKPIYAIANEDAYSAAYAIASAADEIYLSRTAGVGSIGVIAVHVEFEKMFEKQGIKHTAIYAGERKNDFSPYSKLTAEAFKIAEKNVNETYNLFVNTVARNRGLSETAVKGTEAAIFMGNDAVKAGLADAVMPWDQAIKKITSKNKGELTMSLKTDLEKLFAATSKEEITEVLASFGYVPKDVGTINTEAKEIVDLCALVNMPEMAQGLIEKGLSIDDARKQILNEKARQSEQTEIRSTVSALGVGEPNPLLADARKRAATAKADNSDDQTANPLVAEAKRRAAAG